MVAGFMKESLNHIKTVQNYFYGINDVSYRKLRKHQIGLVEVKDPKGLVIAASTQLKNMSDEDFNERRKKLLSKAIQLDFSHAMIALAEDYYRKRDNENAFKLYERAAKLNNIHALKVLSVVYELGIDGFEKDFIKAKELKERAQCGEVWNDYDGFDAERSDYEWSYITLNIINIE